MNYGESSNERRITFLVIFIVLIGAYITFNLFNRSVVGHSEALAKAEKQYYTKRDIPTSRGKIYIQDRINRDTLSSSEEYFPLATNTYNYDVNVVPRHLSDPKKTARELGELLELDIKDLEEKFSSGKQYLPPIKKKIDENLATKIREKSIKGVFLTINDQRIYPEMNLASQILGFVNDEGKGNYGLEEYYNEILVGRKGEVLAEKDNLGRLINIDAEIAPEKGADLVLSLDHNIQFIAEQKLLEGLERFGADSGTIIVEEVETGAILAIANKPDYDPNKFNELKSEDQKFFLNPATSLVWEPGSIMKPIVMAMALDANLVEPDTQGTFSNMVKVGGFEIHNAQDKSYGKETMTQVLENSDNVGMVWVSEKLGKEKMYDYFQGLGFGKKTGIDLQGEIEGKMLDLKLWKDIERSTMSFGQGISVTPIQMVNAYAALANKGRVMKPYLVQKIIENGKERQVEPKEIAKMVSEETSRQIAEMLVSVVRNGHGKKAAVKGYKIGGKTGTAQIPDDKGGYYENKHIGSFAGFFPADNPKYAMLVKFDNPTKVEWAEASAAPIFGEMAEWIINYYGIPPTEPIE